MMESSVPAAQLAPAVLDPRRWRALALFCGAFLMVLLDGTSRLWRCPRSEPISASRRKQDPRATPHDAR
jgi:hypothetical protein